jgi:hypothetical protein
MIRTRNPTRRNVQNPLAPRANHCPNCGAMQEDYLLHSEPGDVFFGLAIGTLGAVEFTALEGRVYLSGDYGFGM